MRTTLALLALSLPLSTPCSAIGQQPERPETRWSTLNRTDELTGTDESVIGIGSVRAPYSAFHLLLAFRCDGDRTGVFVDYTFRVTHVGEGNRRVMWRFDSDPLVESVWLSDDGYVVSKWGDDAVDFARLAMAADSLIFRTVHSDHGESTDNFSLEGLGAALDYLRCYSSKLTAEFAAARAAHAEYEREERARLLALLGTWTGTAITGIESGSRSFPVTLTLGQEGSRAVFGLCGGSLTAGGETDEKYVYVISLQYGKDKCLDGVIVHVRLESDNTLLFTEFLSDGEKFAQATLSRAGQEPPAAQPVAEGPTVAGDPEQMLLGTWAGTVYEEFEGRSTSYPMEMTLATVMSGNEGNKIDYFAPNLECGGSLSASGSIEGKYVYVESIEYGKDKCYDGAIIHVRLQDADVLDLEWFLRDGRKVGWATLSRVGEKPAAAEAAASELTWSSAEDALKYIDSQRDALYDMPTLVNDWRSKAIMIITFKSGEYEEAYAQALNYRTLAHESLAAAELLLEEGDLAAASKYLELYVVYRQMAMDLFDAAGRTAGLAAETMKRVGQAATEVSCLSTKLAAIAAGQPVSRHLIEGACIAMRALVDVNLGVEVSDAGRDVLTSVATYAVWEALPLDEWINDDWQEWVGHSERDGGSGLYRRVADYVSEPAVQEQIMRLAAGSKEFVEAEAADLITDSDLLKVIESYFDYVSAQAGR